ncbi:MAG: protoporphyrinogen oxidase [Nocardioides sp.]
MQTRRTAVIGGGLGGLTAARDLAATGRAVTVYEGSPVIGGKLRTASVAGVAVDVGAEAMLARRPEGVDLAQAVGLDVVHPATTSSAVWTRGALRPLPRSVMGVPGDVAQVAASGILDAAGLDRLSHEEPGPAVDDDVSVGDLVAARLGDEVVDRLVEPLLGGVYAGHARLLSARATVPQLAAWAGGSLLEAAASALVSAPAGPVFAGVEGGLGRLPTAIALDAGFHVRIGSPVVGLRRSPTGFTLVTGPTNAYVEIEVDEVVLATPAAPTARLLADIAPAAAAELAGIDYASMAVVTVAFDADGLDRPAGSGFLVPPVDGRTIKASTFSFNKWDWVRTAGNGLLLLRTSIGRHREESVLQVPDEELVAASLSDLRDAIGLAARPVDTHVQRWGGGLPQYAVGHVDRVARVRAAVDAVPGLAVCGAAYDGVGIPAVIASARRAAASLVAAE